MKKEIFIIIILFVFFGIDYQKDYGLFWKFGNEKKLIYWDITNQDHSWGQEIIMKCGRFELNPCGGYPTKTPEKCQEIIDKSIKVKLF